MKANIWPIGLVACLLAIGGCGVASPTARVTDVRVVERTDVGSRVLVTVEMTNPNDVPLPLPEAEYKLRIARAGRFAFTVVPALALPPRGTQTLELAAALASGNELVGRAFTVEGAVKYRPPGEWTRFMLRYNIPLPSTPFSADGRLAGATEPAAEQ